MANTAPAPLAGLKILDLSRILAGPTCTQLLGDLGADVIKVERPGAGDDTRKWGPPFVTGPDGQPTAESAYYLSANRNKRSVAIDITRPEGAALVRRLAAGCDVLIENFKLGGLKKYGLAYDDLSADLPGLIYCSITGFGQTGPNAHRAGYDFLIQGMAGIMSLTGEPEGQPMKVGVGIADVMCGMYAATAILAALRHRDQTGGRQGGRGQYIDLALYDCQVAWLINGALNYLTSGQVPTRYGNGHPNIVPYQVFPAQDGHFILAVGNDSQYRRFTEVADAPRLWDDPRFQTNRGRVEYREELVGLISRVTETRPKAWWIDALERATVPCGPINDLEEVFGSDQVAARGMKIAMDHPAAGAGQVDLIGNPIRFSETPVRYHAPPPVLGQHTDAVLGEFGLDADEIAGLRGQGIL